MAGISAARAPRRGTERAEEPFALLNFRRRGEKNGPASILAGPFPTLPVAYPSLSRPLSATPTVAKRSAKPSKAPICGMTSVSEAPSARMAV